MARARTTRRSAHSNEASPAGETQHEHDRSPAEGERRRRGTEIPPEVRVARGARALVAIVGRPNVGKSTLFNRLVRRQLAIVEDVPGVTRDRHYADAEVRGRPYVLVDTGGFDPDAKDPVVAGIRNQVRLAIAEADVVVFVTDATTPLQDGDRIAIEMLRKAGRPTIFVANKADSPRRDAEAFELYRLGVPDVIAVSALHGRSIDELESALLAKLPPPGAEDVVLEENVARVAVVGRPNAGKSSLINRLVGSERLLVDSRPGTTTDAIDTLVEKGDRRYVFVDTAGIRRKRAVSAPVEMTSVMQAIRAMERADVVVLLFDITEGALSDQDLRILSLAEERGRGIIIGLNKVDQLDSTAEKKAITAARDRLSFAPWVPIQRLSAKEGRGTSALLAMIDRVYDAYCKRVSTSEVNRFFEEVLDRHPPPPQQSRAVRLYYISQIGIRPPRFAAVSNHPEYIAPSYDRYVQNQLRERFGFDGVPIRTAYRAKRRRAFNEKPEE
jgi:GTP-binding protein